MSKVEKLNNLLLVKDVATGCYMPFDESWQFNGNYEKPTFSPSMRVDYGHGVITHCFVRGGKIQYLSDCSHDMAGKTVDCVDFVYGEKCETE